MLYQFNLNLLHHKLKNKDTTFDLSIETEIKNQLPMDEISRKVRQLSSKSHLGITLKKMILI